MQWNMKLTEALLTLRFGQSSLDHSLFIRRARSSVVAILVYIDNMLVTENYL